MTNSISSIRIVTADYYMQFPIQGLDPHYSDYRGSAIKQVPIIRVFGTDRNGIKTCSHIHGVFPYLYIPYDDELSANSDSYTYQVAASLDKAINISLGQSSSSTQHVFKIVLVKGIPFYGYHPVEHQYLKIYLYNPKFIKRAASLFQNGTILGKVHQPHESHVPYILQFLIDYNLYGMSFLHVPSEVIRYRRGPNDMLQGVNSEQILNPQVERMSVSKMEIDIAASCILNRFQKDDTNSEHANPGIASIWNDERIRRENMVDIENVPTLEVPKVSQRLHARPTESDVFYRETLLSKLKDIQSLSNETLDNSLWHTSITPNNKQFNLKQFLSNSVYPAEFSQNKNANLLNASYVADHFCSKNQPVVKEQQSIIDEFDADESFVDANLIVSLSQKTNLDDTLNPDEYALLEIMEKLETNEINDNVDEEDSILAPLSQSEMSKRILSQNLNVTKLLNQSVINDVEEVNKSNDTDDYFMDSDDDLLNDFSMSFVDNILQPTTTADKSTSLSGVPDSAIPQLDGAADDLINNDKKAPLQKRPKYTPLNISITKTPPKRTALEKVLEMLKDKKEVTVVNNSSYACKRPKIASMPQLAITSIDLTSESSELSPNDSGKEINLNSKTNCIERIKNDSNSILDASSMISCRLTKGIKSQLEKGDLKIELIKKDKAAAAPKTIAQGDTINVDKIDSIFRNDNKLKSRCEIRLKNCDINMMAAATGQNPSSLPICLSPTFKKIIQASPMVKLKKFNNLELDCSQPTKRYPIRNRNPRPLNKLTDTKRTTAAAYQAKDRKDRKDKKKQLCLEQMYEWSDCAVSNAYDTRMNFFPEPGPSHTNFYDYVCIPGYYSNNEEVSSTDHLPVLKTANESKKNDNEEYNSSNYLSLSNKICSPISDDLFDQFKNSTSFYNNSADCKFVLSPTELTPPTKHDTDVGGKDFEKISSDTWKNLGMLYRKSKDFSSEDTVIITPKMAAPTTKDLSYNIPKVESKRPFYGNNDDVSSKKEIGHTILQIPGNSLNDLDEFQSSNITTGLTKYRKKCFLDIISSADESKQPTSSNQIREFLSTEKPVVIFPNKGPPTVRDAKLWTTARQSKRNNERTDEAYPIKTKMILEKSKENMVNCDISNTTPIKANGNSNASSKDVTIVNISDDDEDVIPATPPPKITISHFKRSSTIDRSLKRLKFSRTTESPNMFSDNEPATPPSENLNHHQPNEELTSHIFPTQQLNDSKVINQFEQNDSSSHSNDSTIIINSVNKNKLLDRTTSSYVNKLNLDRSTFGINRSMDHSFGISAASLENTFGFKMDLENFQTANTNLEFNYLTIMSLEVHVKTRGTLNPDPAFDEITCIFYAIQNNVPDTGDAAVPTSVLGLILNDKDDSQNYQNNLKLTLKTISSNVQILQVTTECELLMELIKLIAKWDPDIYTGYEIEMASWGYVMQRAKMMNVNLPPLISRIPSEKIYDASTKLKNDQDGRDVSDIGYELQLSGRIFLDFWRLLRSEIALTSYTFENCMYHIMHKRYPLHSNADKTKMWNNQRTRWIVLEYYLERTQGTLEILNQLDLIGRTCEMAKLFGIQFYEVLSRGSQYRVESMMLRIAKPRNIIPVSPSVQQRAHMRAPEYLPLILEPHSRMYTDSLIVLDFQSLYPSIIIAYNYCFSTCLGRVEQLGQSHPFEFGASQLRVSPTLLRKLVDRDLVTFSPCGAAFVKSSVREGILPRLLREILDTRLMVKQSMKLHKNDKLLQRILHSRQLGLKLMANVTYGYTAANFSGRMPCVEVGDSVVSKGRETLERAIKMVNDSAKWNSKVIYGDTDSLFVLVSGRPREEAFKIGEEISEAVTNDNPFPIKLKLEKIYQPSILQTKKRYVGYMYETVDQKLPKYEAKGIETVRRDGCPAVAKMLEKTLKILFDTCDVSAVKRYVCRQFTKILSGRTNVQDLIFAKEFRGLDGYKPGACVPAMELTKKWRQIDRRAEPRTGERVPYVVINGPPGVPLIRLVRSPHEYLADEGLKINAMYYITKVIIPPLNRCLLLIGADVFQWYADLPRKFHQMPQVSTASRLQSLTLPQKNNQQLSKKKSTISQYFSTTSCVCDCGEQTKAGICVKCLHKPAKSAIILSNKISQLDRRYLLTQKLCQSCCGRQFETNCTSLDCPILFVLNNHKREHKQIEYFKELLDVNFPLL